MTFKDLGINEDIIKTLKKCGITSPTEIQKRSIKEIINGKDIIAEAQTGTGKTLAFLLPIFEKL